MATTLDTANLQAGIENFLSSRYHRYVGMYVNELERQIEAEAQRYLDYVNGDPTEPSKIDLLGVRLGNYCNSLIDQAGLQFERYVLGLQDSEQLYPNEIEMIDTVVRQHFTWNIRQGTFNWHCVADAMIHRMCLEKAAESFGPKHAVAHQETTESNEPVVTDLAATRVVVRTSTGKVHKGMLTNTGTLCSWDGQVRSHGVYTKRLGKFDAHAIENKNLCKKCFPTRAAFFDFATRTGQHTGAPLMGSETAGKGGAA